MAFSGSSGSQLCLIASKGMGILELIDVNRLTSWVVSDAPFLHCQCSYTFRKCGYYVCPVAVIISAGFTTDRIKCNADKDPSLRAIPAGPSPLESISPSEAAFFFLSPFL